MSFQRNRVTRRVITDIKKRSSIGILFYFIICGLVLLPGGFHSRHPHFSLHFTGWVLGIGIFRIIHLIVAQWIPPPYVRLSNLVFLGSLLLTSLIWGILFAYFMNIPGEYNSVLLMTICTTGLAAGGAVAFIPNLLLTIFYNLSMLLPASLWMMLHNIHPPRVMAILMFSLYLVIMAIRSNREYWDALENEFLLQEKTKELKTLSRIDVLTGLFNRRHFDERFAYEFRRSMRNRIPVTLLICDIDHFKNVNDTYGHLAGDEFLKMTADILKSAFRRSTDTVARYGGEEFVVLIPNDNSKRIDKKAEQVRKKVSATPLVYNGQKIFTTLSIGMASAIAEKQEQPETLIQKADAALYHAKREGRNRVVVNR